MPDITNEYLEAAIIDQKVAGEFQGKVYAFVAVVEKSGWKLGVAVANEQGYNPVEGKIFKNQGEAKQWAEGLNKHIKVSEEDYLDIVSSTMRGPKVAVR
jgi:hypothetical protein